MNLDELQSIRDRERQSDSLQQLRESFYADVGEFVQQLRTERDQAAARADDPFDAPEVNRLTDDINTAEQTVEAIYERRVGKLVKMASFAAADMPTDDDGLTAEERDLFEQLVAAIEANREQVFSILDGDESDGGSVADAVDPASADATPDAEPDVAVDAADLMAGDGPATTEASESEPSESADARPPAEVRAAMAEDAAMADDDADASNADDARAPAEQEDSGGDEPSKTAEPDPSPDGGSVETGSLGSTAPETGPAVSSDRSEESSQQQIERATVRITEEVGEIFGVDEREYDLSREDVVTLPETNADPLVEAGAAERID